MERTTTPGRVLATLAGGAFAFGGLTILLDRQLLDPRSWASAQWLTILMVFGVIAAGHLMVTAAKTKHWPSTAGFLLLFVVGTWLVVYSSVGRQVEAAGTTSLSVEDVNKRIVDKSADLDGARQRKAYADSQVQKMMTGSFCGRGCKDWKQNSRDIAVVIKQVEIEIAALGPQKPVNAQAEAMADIVLLFPLPATKAQVVAVLTLLVPFSKTLFFEIGSIVSLGFAFRPTPARIPAKSEAPRIPGNSNSGNSGPAKPPRRGRKTDPKIVEFQDKFRERRGHVPSAAELKSAFPGIATSTAYAYVARSRKHA